MTKRRHTILVVDDDADARLVMRAALRKAGYDVREAEGGQDALRKFRAEPCDMVMLDVDMPDLGGHEVCAALRVAAGSLLPIVMVTGMDDLQSVEAAYDSGATDFIAKPVNWALIGHRVRYLFRSHQAMQDLRVAESRNAAVLNAIPDLLFELDIDGRYVDYRAPHTDLLAAPPEAFLDKTVDEILPPAAAQVCMAALRTAFDRGSASGAQIELPLAAGSAWFELSVSRKAVAAGEKPRFIVLSREITERKDAEARIARLAYFDSLTGLPNRQSFLDRVNREIVRAGDADERLAVLFIDLDGFKGINDTMGHAAGDLLLQCAATRIRDGLRPSDVLSRPMGLDHRGSDEFELARLGGDEFTVLILGIEHPEDAALVAQRIGAMMRRPFALEGREVTVTTSVGIAIYPDDGDDGAMLLKHADTAMYHAKQTGRDNVQVYRPSLTRELVQRMELDSDMRIALEQGQFHLVYQPQVDVGSGRIRSIEALIRWTHPVRGLIPPLDFIPRAEENGLIDEIGLWVLRTACAQAVQWQRAGTPVAMAVNLSPLQFRSPRLQQLVMEVLAQTSLAPGMLELEVTEGTLMENSIVTRAVLKSLNDAGIGIALDDFGTGYSSLAYLTRMPIGNIKVDKCFVGGLLEGGENEAIVRAILAIAHSLGTRVTAEGVESLEQANALAAMACDCLQGYYFSQPVAGSDIPPLLSRQWSLTEAPPSELAKVRAMGVAPIALVQRSRMVISDTAGPSISPYLV
ncbi:MAG: EAL domain-containing protein [Candidatus Methylophosphatis roskildensis]